jgi:hypothetical protein
LKQALKEKNDEKIRKLISQTVVGNWAIERWWSMFKQASATTRD